MTRVRGDFLPVKISPGELAAIADADQQGIIELPLYNCLEPAPPRPWGLAHCRYLVRRGLAIWHTRRLDGLYTYRLTAAGLALR